ncbi:hypothetical protein [Actinomadura sp. 3N407]|uniref:hypothetical protein n=1 Tax=Actinomadura sp. 3N407 TaxID=3457423 RepID=UPI003FCEB08A
MAKRWVRYVMPVMAEVDDEADEITRVVTLPEEIREDRDDMGNFLIYDDRFVRETGDEPAPTHAFCVAEPRWEHPQFRVGGPVNWPKTGEWEEGFDMTEADDRYAEINPYALDE